LFIAERNAVRPSVSVKVQKKRAYTHIATNNFGRILIADGEYNDNFGRFRPILWT